MEAICIVGLPDILQPLEEIADHGLIQRANQPDGTLRFHMPEVVHEYATERLNEHVEADAIRQAHAAYFLAFTERAAEGLDGPDQGAWMAKITAESSNLNVALEFAITQQNPDTAFRLAAKLWGYWARRGNLWEGRMWLERVLATGAETRSGDRLFALHALGNLAIDLADFPRAQSLFEEIREISNEIGDESWTIVSRNGLGIVAWYQGDYDEAKSLHEANLLAHRSRDERRYEALALHNLGNIAIAEGRNDEARALHKQALTIHQEINDAGGIAYSTLSLGQTACNTGDLTTAQTMFEQCLAMFDEGGDQLGIAYTLYFLGRVSSLRRDYHRASEYFADAIALRHDFGDRRGIVECVEGIASVATAVGALEQAARLFGAAASARISLGAPIPPGMQASVDADLEILRRALGDAALSASLAHSRSMTLDQAEAEAAAVITSLGSQEQ
jgi:tetratricopeptide (TPR) repeat protein